MQNMEKYCIANAHAHIFPEKIAAKAVRSIGDFYDLHMGSSGLADALLADGSASLIISNANIITPRFIWSAAPPPLPRRLKASTTL